jgi:PAS domain S-box-containing protein
MLKFYFNKRILVGFILALAILSWLAVASFLNTQNFIRSGYMIAHTLDVLYSTEHLMANVANLELGQRGYTITGNEEFLRPYSRSKEEIGKHINNLQKLTSDNQNQQERVASLRNTIEALLIFSTATIELRKKNGVEAAMQANASLRGKELMDTIREIIAGIETEENFLLKERSSAQKFQLENFNYTFTGLLIATGIILISIYIAINIIFKRRSEAESRLRAISAETKDLYDNAPCGYHSLDASGSFANINNTLLNWLGYKRDEVVGKMKFTDVIPAGDYTRFYESFENLKKTGEASNVEFNFKRRDGSDFPVSLNAAAIKDSNGQYVKSRSTTFDITERKRAEAKIRNLNHELEAFTYSVSHDLRAPLRSIDGYSKILLEDYFDKLDEEGQRVIQVIMNNAKRMSKLIDDLLEFSRLGRKDISLASLNMTHFVKNIAQELAEHEGKRNIAIKVNPLLPSAVDIDMMHQVWENLLSNAIKYTGKNPNPSIEVSSIQNGNEVAYSVKDNGVGFDMQYVGKLFNVFQRLHKIQDFNGTGIGLAIVKRIIDRHNGRVWAEGKLNGGATFYFTIPKQ